MAFSEAASTARVRKHWWFTHRSVSANAGCDMSGLELRNIPLSKISKWSMNHEPVTYDTTQYDRPWDSVFWRALKNLLLASLLCVCLGHDRASCKNGWTDRDAVWNVDFWRPWNGMLDGGPNPNVKGHFCSEEHTPTSCPLNSIRWYTRTKVPVYKGLCGSSNAGCRYHHCSNLFLLWTS